MGKIGVRKTTEEFILEVMRTHKLRYDYSKVDYINNNTKVCIICPEHGEFWQIPMSHLKGHGCRRCAIVKKAEMRSIYELNKKFEGLVQPEDYKFIPMPSGELVIVDNDDFNEVKDINWRGAGSNGKYADNPSYGRMHRYIMNAPDDMVVDHINGNPLDNRKSNLRICTHHQNLMNRSANNTSNYKGVRPSKNSWSSRITYNCKEYHLGTFSTEEEAARAYDAKARELFGEFARLNFKD